MGIGAIWLLSLACLLVKIVTGFIRYTVILNKKTTLSEPRHEISNNVVCATSKGSDQPAHTRSLLRAFASRLNMYVKLLTEEHLEFLSLK